MSRDSSTVYDDKARPKPHLFYPPKPKRLAIAMVQRGIRGALRRRLRVTEVEISSEHLELLRRHQGQRCLATPSHSGGYEPHVMMYLSKQLGDYFNYVAALEVFEQSPLNRWLMPRIGCYSILRGAVDRASFAMTRKLLAEGKRWLVIFPEGEAIGQNSAMVPFQQGVFQLAFKAAEDARREQPDADLICLPIAIKYIYLRDMQDEIRKSLDQIELQLALKISDRPTDPHDRLRRISEAVLSANEKAQGVKPTENATMDDRIQHVKQQAIVKLEHLLGITPNDRQSPLDRIRTLFNTVDRIVHDESPESPYEQQLAAERTRNAKTLYDELWRLLKFVAVYDGYVSESMTVERFMDILALLEHEVLSKRRVWGPRKAMVQVGSPVHLDERWADYMADRRQAVADVTSEVEIQVRNMLDAIGRENETVM